MCGIAGIFAYHYAAAPVDRAELRAIRDAMEKRGPDGFGEWFSDDGRVGLGHRRLSIIDLDDRASQPMVSVDGKHVISFNGEIYNYRELRFELEIKGRHFRTESDTEVLLQMYAEHGTQMLTKLRGMFAFALWDGQNKKTLLARDPYGIKPLYYADDGWTLRFASQVKALLKSEKVSRIKEPAGAVGFFLMGNVPEPFTLYQEIRQVPAGSFVWVDSTGPYTAECYESISEIYSSSENKSLSQSEEQNQAEEICNALAESVQYHFVSDVPVGIFLSAGIDSSAIASLSTQFRAEQTTAVTLSCDEFTGTSADEAPLAKENAQRLGLKYQKYCLTRSEFEQGLPQFFDAMDQPTLDGLNTYFVSKAAKSFGLKAALSGIGGDELFGGYPSFARIPQLVRNLGVLSRVPGAGNLWKIFYHLFLRRSPSMHPKVSGLVCYGGSQEGAYFLTRGLFMPWELPTVIDKDFAHHGLERLGLMRNMKASIRNAPKNLGVRASILESSWYLRNQLLRDTDWAAMAHSLEIRTPFVDIVLLKKITRYLLNNRTWKKELLVKAMDKQLPVSIAQRKKTGFTLPMQAWVEKTESSKKASRSEPQCPWSRRWACEVYERFAA